MTQFISIYASFSIINGSILGSTDLQLLIIFMYEIIVTDIFQRGKWREFQLVALIWA
jgi:hypothetical protein